MAGGLRVFSSTIALFAFGCAAPAWTQEGQLVFSEREQRGATVLTANGVEFLDRAEIPSPILRRSAFEPWRPPTGFLLPADGVLRERSRPEVIEGPGLAVVLRASDVIVPAWGGELLLRLDTIVPARAFAHAQASLRQPIQLVVVIDDDGHAAQPLIEAAFDSLGQRDRAALVDSAQAPKPALPLVPGTHRTLLEGAAERVLELRSRGARKRRDLGAALRLAGELASRASLDGIQRRARVLLVTDGVGMAIARTRAVRAAKELAARGVELTAVASTDRVERDTLEGLGPDVHVSRDRDELERAVMVAFPPPGEVVLYDLVLGFASAPAPARLLEASAGELAMTLEDDQLELGDLYVGEARTEVVRLAIPQWTHGEPYVLNVTARYRDGATGRVLSANKRVSLVYSEDIEQIGNQRRGDVIAYASALAMVKRLERAFLGSQAARFGGFSALVGWQARSLARLGTETGDISLTQQAEVLEALLKSVEN